VEDETGSWETTRVYKINVDESTIEYVADGSIPGRVLNQFSIQQ
jgi:hypothetical protein